VLPKEVVILSEISREIIGSGITGVGRNDGGELEEKATCSPMDVRAIRILQTHVFPSPWRTTRSYMPRERSAPEILFVGPEDSARRYQDVSRMIIRITVMNN